MTPEWAIVDMRAAALALPDVTMARGTYPVPVPRPYISGQEGVGVVREASDTLAHLVGSRVVGVFIQPWGSLADTAVAVGPSIMPAPAALDDIEAAAFVIPAHTAYHAVIRRGQVQAGETVLVTGAAGGLGSACVQLAAAQGARVIAVVGSSAKRSTAAGSALRTPSITQPEMSSMELGPRSGINRSTSSSIPSRARLAAGCDTFWLRAAGTFSVGTPVGSSPSTRISMSQT